MAARADAVQQAGEAGRAEVLAHVQGQLDQVRAELARSQQTNEQYENALQAALEERLTEFAANQHWRFTEVEGRLQRVTDEVALAVPAQIEAASAPLQQRFEHSTELMASRIEELQRAARRFDEQSSALVQHVNDTTAAFNRRLDDSGRVLSSSLDERTMALSQRADEAMVAMRQFVVEQSTNFGRRIEDNDARVVNRMLAMEERVNEHAGTRLAAMEATVGRISSGIDEAIIALSQRVIELENQNLDVMQRINEVAEQIGKIDEEAISQLRDQMSSAIGEAMLVRIELERVASSTGEQFDKINVRIAEVEATVTETVMDVSTAIQLERLEELERAITELDPTQYVRKGDLLSSGPQSPGMAPPPPTQNSSESSLSSW
ncbi:unannotated protein [freshwater metagenome]|uniref:Unannotated protein n=1 Tax=freshwater metagenome TaxID=449393 RepID=A0A6J7CGS8_9ZZZZ